MLVKTFGAAVQGIDATPVTIEVNIAFFGYPVARITLFNPIIV